MPISLRIAPISSSHSEMTRQIIVMTISSEPDSAEHAQHQQVNNVESISHSCVSSPDRDELAWEKVVVGQDARNYSAVSSALRFPAFIIRIGSDIFPSRSSSSSNSWNF